MNSEIKVDFVFYSYYIMLYALTILLISQSLLAVSSVILQILITCMFRLMSTFSGDFDTKLSSYVINLHEFGSTVFTQTVITIACNKRPLKTEMQQTSVFCEGFNRVP